MEPFRLEPGATPLLIHVPHAGTHLPAEIRGRMTPAGRALIDTDWHVDRLYDFAAEVGAGLMVANHSRYLVDLNRAPRGDALYGAPAPPVPSRDFAGRDLYVPGQAPDAAEIAQRIAAYWEPHHAALESELLRLRRAHGHALLLDAHSIRSQVPSLFAGRLPDLNLGSNRGRSAEADLIRRAYAGLGAGGNWTTVLDGRFVGGYITRHYGRPDRACHALQLELSQRAYLEEEPEIASNAPPPTWTPERAAPLRRHLRQWLAALRDWRPMVPDHA